jgi:hypothetical protein
MPNEGSSAGLAEGYFPSSGLRVKGATRVPWLATYLRGNRRVRCRSKLGDIPPLVRQGIPNPRFAETLSVVLGFFLRREGIE